ncbi:RNA methyltransferase [Desulfuromonas sp. AOP6]|uniref:RNA methyltransferase n=1 Tax=Desulfuromonas sp. AOP6 TaxID=1566351 RepID=UPI001271AE1A|nr:RNA methyltransferase [Desulfuromonas sp. AOP6]BCA80546.1 hypothetical protein AOP6_2333 [Desulfuromonas sp. AOP6]
MNRRPLAVALVHHPVVDRRGDLVTTAVTNLDVHDIARTARTYGVDRFYLVTPVQDQLTLIQRILDHWRQGHGADYNPHRGDALSLVRVSTSLQEALTDWGEAIGETPLPLLTGAQRQDGLSYEECRELTKTRPLMLVLGTGWGLAPSLFERDWPVLAPIRGNSDYNHLPVRAAAAIMLDRLLAPDEK